MSGGDFHRDVEQVAEILKKDFSGIYTNRPPDERTRRSILSPERTMGSVIHLFAPSPEYKEEHNAWLHSLPYTLRELLFTVKRYYRPEWGENWREHFAVDRVNGVWGHELKLDDQKLVNYYLRVGYDEDGLWRVYKLRPDFHPADKVQVEDDITVSIVVPRESLEAAWTRNSVIPASSWFSIAKRFSSSVRTTLFIAAPISKPRPTSPAPVRSYRITSRSTPRARLPVHHGACRRVR